MTRDPVLDWLKEHDPEATTPGYGDRYASIPRHSKEVTASSLDRVDEDGNVEPFDGWDSMYDDDEPGARAYVPEELRDIATLLRPAPRPPASHYRKALAEHLTAAELVHLGWIEHGDTQHDIAVRLGISQPAVAKRERALIAKVDAVHRKIIGSPYPRAMKRRPGVRGRKAA